MKSRTKYELSEKMIVSLFEKAGIQGAENIKPLGAGEFNSVYSIDARGKEYALKVAPAGDAGTLTYEKNMIEQEVFYYAHMRNDAKIKVPEIYFVDFSKELIPAGYFIMERLRGEQLDKANLTAEEKAEAQRKTARMVAQMHSVRGAQFGYRQNGLHDDWYLALSAMVGNLIKDCARFGKKTKRGEKLLAYIRQNKEVLLKAESRLINFDIWSPNIFCSRGNNGIGLAWIDPERCLWGDHIADFVCLEFMKMSLDKKTASVEAYNKAGGSPLEITDDERIRFAIMLGYLGLIMETEKYARYTRLHFGWWRNVIASKMLFSNAFKQLKALRR